MSRRSHAHADDRRVPTVDEQLAGTFFAPEMVPTPPVHRVPVSAHMRTVSGPVPPDGEKRRNAALEDHERQAAKRAAIVYVRARLLGLYRSRAASSATASVNADDVDEILRAWPQFDPALRDGHQAWRGMIFRGGGWERTGTMVTSRRDHMHATDLPCWRAVGVDP